MKLVVDNTKDLKPIEERCELERKAVLHAIDYLLDELSDHQDRLLQYHDIGKLDQLVTLLDYFRLKEVIVNELCDYQED